MNNSFFNNFYLLTKLTTTLILFFAVLFLGYLLVKSYKVNNEESYLITIDDKINALSQSIENYSQKLISINQKVSDNKKSLSLLNETSDNNFLDAKFDELLKKNQNLQKQITNLGNSISSSENRILKYNENKGVNNTVSNLIDLIELKYENGSNINTELLLLQNQVHDDSKKAYLEKLFILSDQKFIGIVNLQNQFEKLMRKYLKDYYKKKNGNLFINYLINFFYIEPNYNSNFKNETLKRFSMTRNKLYEKDIKSSLQYLSLIDDSDIYFDSWIEEAKNYIDFNENIRFFYNS
jgi:hypothetical protein|tara:strand:+ start:22 stop:903 length:882 start_codon:yes stop_codon:yes gene_type:complete